ncbi:MAG: YceI family protein, partial [Holophagales bacterium]|nr:YceI family protein [Holophagales bacterium]
TLSLHGHTGEVPVSFEVVGESPLHIKGEATMQRTAFGIGEPYDSSNDRSITDDVKILVDTKVE